MPINSVLTSGNSLLYEVNGRKVSTFTLAGPAYIPPFNMGRGCFARNYPFS